MAAAALAARARLSLQRDLQLWRTTEEQNIFLVSESVLSRPNRDQLERHYYMMLFHGHRDRAPRPHPEIVIQSRRWLLVHLRPGLAVARGPGDMNTGLDSISSKS